MEEALEAPAIIIPERLKDVKAFFDKETETSDAILRVEGESLYVNRAVITLASKELASKFTQPDGATAGKMEAALDEKKCWDVLDMMTFIYPNLKVFIDETNVESLMALAYEYKIEVLLNRCIAVMDNILTKVNQYMNQSQHEKVLRYLKQTDMFCIADLREKCINVMCSQPYGRDMFGQGGFSLTSAFKTLPDSVQQELILKRLTYIEETKDY